MLTTTITVFSRDKAYSDALDILLRAEIAAIADDADFEGRSAEDWLGSAQMHLGRQWKELHEARMTRTKGKV